MNLPKTKENLLSWPGSLIICVCIFVFFNFFRPIEIEDIWWHLKTGEWIVTHLQVPHHDLFPFGNEQAPWIFTQWLGSSFLYLIYKFCGLFGLKVFRALLFIGTILLFFKQAIGKARLPVVMALVLLLIPALYSRSNLRPDIFNYIFIQIFLIQLFRFQRSNNAKDLIPLPLWGILWSNIHLGSFVYGIPLIGAFLLSSMGQFNFNKSKALALVLFFYCASFLVSPYGYEALLYPFKVFLIPDYLHFYFSLNTIDEMTPLLKYPYWYLKFFWSIPLFFTVVILLSKKENKANRLLYALLSFLSLFMYLRGVRAAAFFAIVISYVILESLSNIQGVKNAALNKFQKCFWLIVISVLLLKSFYLYHRTDFKNGRQVKDISLDIEAVNPGAALAFMDRFGLQGKVFNGDIFGGLIIWSSYPRLRPFMDGRNNSRRFVEYHQILQDPTKYWTKYESRYDFKILLLDTKQEGSFSLARCLNKKIWQLVYFDDASIIYARRDSFHFSREVLELETQLKNIPISPEDKKNIKVLLGRDNPKEGINPSFLYPKSIDLINEGETLLKLGYREAGYRTLLGALNKAPRQEIEGILRSYWIKIDNKEGVI